MHNSCHVKLLAELAAMACTLSGHTVPIYLTWALPHVASCCIR